MYSTFAGVLHRRAHAICAVSLLAACSARPSDARLTAWHDEAVAANAARLAAQPAVDPAAQWELHVVGQVAHPLSLSMKEILARPSIEVNTRTPENTADFTAILHYRVIPLATLLAAAGASPDAKTVTIMATDAFRATIDIADLARWPEIGVAVAQDGKPIPRTQGGPVQLVFPYTKYPELEPRYGGRAWCWYVTDLIVGTEPARVTVGQTTLDAAALAKLPQTVLDEEVGYKVNWPATKVKLTGVRLRDLIAAAGGTLPDGGVVIVRGKAQIDHDAAQPSAKLDVADVKAYDILLATHWGDDDAPIPAQLGGPVTLAFPPECKAKYGEKRWVTFVEGVEVKQPPSRGAER